MNLLLLEPDCWLNQDEVCLTDPKRIAHLHEVHRAQEGDSLTVGALNGKMGRATLTKLTPESAHLKVSLTHEPPKPLPVHLILALPRPRMLARSLEHITSLGVKEITLLHTKRVEKSYWQSPELKPEKIRQHFILGLEQARDTVMPKLNTATRFKPFIEDELPTAIANKRLLIAHPGMAQACPSGITQPSVLAIGPEGGFIDYEVERFQALGFEGIHLGERILRVETAITALLAKLF